MLTERQKYQIILLLEEEKSIRVIGKKLSLAYTTVHDFILKYKKTSSVSRLKGSGRPKLLENTDIKRLCLLKEENNLLSPVKLCGIFTEETGIKISPKTIKRYLKREGYYAGRLISKPRLTPHQKLRRYELCKKWSMYNKYYWKNVIFSDETKFNLKNSDGPTYVWKKRGERLQEKNIKKTVKFGGGSVMFWGCFSSLGVGNLIVVEGIMDSYKYVDILRNNLCDSAKKIGLNEYKFQQDNDPKHTSKYTCDYTTKNNLNMIEWPSQSPDLNPIENLWAYIKKKLEGKNFSNKTDLILYVKSLWDKTPVSVCENLVSSMDERILQVLRANGGYSDY